MTGLPRSAPRDHDVSSRAVAALLDAAESTPGLELHSLMIVRHGSVVAEGWWHPYTPDGAQLLYSLSKSFTATAIGLAQAEGLLSVDDLVMDLLPDHAPGQPDAHLRSLRVRNLLAMATGHRSDLIEVLDGADDPARVALATPAEEAPGTLFTYNQGATFLLSAIITTLSGQRLLDFLRPRLLEPLGIVDANWSGRGDLDDGFSGLHVSTEAIAKLGLLYLKGGRWQDRQLLPAAWVQEASRPHVSTVHHSGNPDWQQGYGFQFWMNRQGYRGDGAYGQFCLVLPEHDAVVVTTASAQDMQALLDLVWQHLVPGFGGGDGADDDSAVYDRLAALALAPVCGQAAPRDAPVYAPIGALAALTSTDEGWRLRVSDRQTTVEIACGRGRWLPTEVRLDEHHVLEVLSSGGWQSDGSFEADVLFVRTPHRMSLRYDPTTGATSRRWNTQPLNGSQLGAAALDLRRG